MLAGDDAPTANLAVSELSGTHLAIVVSKESVKPSPVRRYRARASRENVLACWGSPSRR